MRLTLFIIQLYIFIPLFTQNNFSSNIDSILEESFQKFSQLEFIESSELANHALQLSTMENYSQGKVTSNICVYSQSFDRGGTKYGCTKVYPKCI